MEPGSDYYYLLYFNGNDEKSVFCNFHINLNNNLNNNISEFKFNLNNCK